MTGRKCVAGCVTKRNTQCSVGHISCLNIPTTEGREHTDGFQMSIKRPTSGGQTRDREAAVQRNFHFERSSFFYLSVLMVRTRCSTY